MGRTSKQDSREGIESTENSKFAAGDNPPMSGAYIRSLVKQLASSTTPQTTVDQMAMASQDQDLGDSEGPAILNFPQFNETQPQQSSSRPPPPPHKKQVRRRLHTTRPYQERLLNMAEARRGIVAALKFHRAAMKQAQEQREQRKKHQKFQTPSPLPQPIHQSLNYMNSQFDGCSIPSSSFPYQPSHNLNPSSKQDPFSWLKFSPISSLTSSADSLTLTLPSQTLGLNLNLGDFDNICQNGSTTPPTIYSGSLPLSSSSSSSAITVSQEVGPASVAAKDGRRHDEVMAEEMRSIGERHQMEWNDRMNLVTSAWWFEFLKGMEDDEEAIKRAAEECCSDGGFQIFDEIMEFPPWLGSGESGLQPHLVDDYFSDDYLQDAGLPSW